MRAVIYARYSTDLQREASIEDQVRVCRQRIDRECWTLLATYSDAATSGASRLRAGYQKLLEDARAGAFDVVVAEALDRLSRDQEDVAGLFKHLSFAGVKLVTLAEGEINELHVGLKGTMNALFLKDLAQKVRRGLEGRVRQGRSGGRLCYGSHLLREHDGRVQAVPGLRIGSQGLWDQAKARQLGMARNARPDVRGDQPFWTKQRPRYLVSGVAKCGACGGGYVKISQNLFGCAAARNKGTCDNRLNIRIQKLEDAILAALKSKLMAPDLFKEFCHACHAEVNRL